MVFLGGQGGDGLEGKLVGEQAEAGHGADGHRGHHRGMPERLARRRVGDVHLHQRGGPHGQRVAQRVGVVGERGRVDHDRHPGVGGLVHPADQLAFAVGLPDVHVQAERTPGGAAQVGQVVEGCRAVDLRFPGPEPAQVGAVEHKNLRYHLDTSW